MDNKLKDNVDSLEFAIDILKDFCDIAPEEITEVYNANIIKLKALLKDINNKGIK